MCAFVTVVALIYLITHAGFGTSLGKMLLGENPNYYRYLERARVFNSDEVLIVAVEDVDVLGPENLAKLKRAVTRIKGIALESKTPVQADAVELHAVIDDSKTVSFSDPVLASLDLIVAELHDAPTFNADEVVVVFIVEGRLIARCGPTQSGSAREPTVHEQVNGPVQGREADPRLPRPDQGMQFTQVQMPLALEEGLGDHAALVSQTEAMSPHVLL